MTYKQRQELEPGLNLDDLIQGKTYEFNEATDLLINQEIIKEACKEFKNNLFAMASIGGEEVVDI